MAAVMGPVRSAGFLPTIKCSDCSAEIEISRIGDHVCAGVSLPTSKVASFGLPFITLDPNLPNQSAFRANNVRPLLVKAPNINTKVSLPPVNRLPRSAPVNSPRYPFQNSSSSGRQSPLDTSSRNTLHSNRSSLSDASLSQDCAFPPFPTSRIRSPTPNGPPESSRSFAILQSGRRASGDLNSAIMPLFSQGNGDTVLHKKDPTVPGPVIGFQTRGHRKTPSIGSSKDFTYQRIGQSEMTHSSRPSTANSNSSRKPSLSSISGGPRSRLVDIDTDVPKLPAMPGDPIQSFTISGLSPDRKVDLAQQKTSIEKLRHESRSLTYPLDNPTKEGNSARRPSAPSLHMKRPSVAAAIRPLHEIGSVSTFKPSKSLRRRPKSPVSLTISEAAAEPIGNGRTGESRKIDNVSAVSEIHLSSEHRVETLHHATASSSSSSRASSKSGVGSASSASTASLSGSPSQQKRRPSEGDHNLFMQDFRFVIKPQAGVEEPTSPRDCSPTFSNRLARTDPADLPALTESMTLAPPPTRDPAVHSGRSSPITPSNDSFAALPPPSNNLVPSSGHIFTSPSAHLPKTHRTASPNKGRCKGCDDLIVGKSVSSADGRLTGRYHRGCFTCMTCKEVFRTADFYIHDNHPYCQRHYHQLNQSLCIACDSGIEGQYIETENREKFHQGCFTCQDCKNVLRDHYYEINGERYCERHAVREPQQQLDRSQLPSQQRGPGAGARPHAERRQTRLLMMAP